MRSSDVKFGVCFSLVAALAAAGTNEARATPLHPQPSVFERISTPSIGDDRMSSVDGRRLVRLRPSAGFGTGRARWVDAGVFEATPGGRPISDAYDFAGVEFERVARITPVDVKMIPAPESPVGRSNTPRQSKKVWNVGLKTLDYMVLTTKNILESLSRILNGNR